MSTTYAKIRATLAEMGNRSTWSPKQLKEQLVRRDKRRGENNFHIRQNSSTKAQPVSDGSLDKLFNMMIDLDLIRKNKEDDLFMPEVVKTALDDDARYKLLLSRRITDLLERNNADIGEIKAAALSINYPSVRDPETILKIVQQKGKAEQFTVPTFTQVLFLLANAEHRAERHMRIFYEFK
jgi:hypothetical protein